MAKHDPKELIADLITGRIDSEALLQLQRKEKDPGRLSTICQIYQEMLGWPEPVVGLVQEHLLLVDAGSGERTVRCTCVYDFGDCRRNWKEGALVYERHPRDGQIYTGPRGADPDWMVLREFYCPGCSVQLDVEMVPPGYPFIFHFLPADVETDQETAG